MRKIVSICFIVLLFASCSNFINSTEDPTNGPTPSTPSNTTETDDNEKNNISNSSFSIPSLYIEYNDQQYPAVTGTSTWYYNEDGKIYSISMDSSITKLINSQEVPIIIGEAAKIKLVFDIEPISYEVSTVNLEKSELSQVVQSKNDFICIDTNQPQTIYRVIAKFEIKFEEITNTGSVYYLFIIN